MRSRLYILAVIVSGALVASAQVASHGPVASHAAAAKAAASVTAPSATPESMLKPVVKINGAVLTEIDLVREMYTIFPYALQHNGFPKSMEADIRKGAMEMIVFEELVYQEARRRNMTVSPEKMARAQAAFRKQFPDQASYERHIQTELHGSKQALNEKIRRSLLIEQLLKTEVDSKSRVTRVAAKEFYDKNPKTFEHGETIEIQTISIIPPENASKQLQEEARLKITDILRLARKTKSYKEFGSLAEQLSDDDWRTHMGDRKTVDVSKMPPEVVKAARAMKPGQVSDIIQLDRAYVVFRLNAHTSAGKTPFADVQAKLQSDLQKERTVEYRAALNRKLRKDAKIEML